MILYRGNRVARTTPSVPMSASSAVDHLGAHALAVLETLRGTPQHPTAACLYDDVRRQHPRLGRATVYRALAALEAAGLVVEAWRDGVGRHYDARTDPHDHAICVACGAVTDIDRPADRLPSGYIHAAERSGFTIRRFEVRYHGLCSACQERRATLDDHTGEAPPLSSRTE